MIEIDGTALPLEPGKTYLLVCSKRAVGTDSVYKLASAIKQRENINLYVLMVNGDPSDVVVKGPFLDNGTEPAQPHMVRDRRDDEPGPHRSGGQ